MYKLIRAWHNLSRWWALNPSVTRFFPLWANKRLQKAGERRRSEAAHAEPETNLPFPYNDFHNLSAYCHNRLMAEPDFEPYWKEQQRLIDIKSTYSRASLLKGFVNFLTLEEPK